MLPNGGPGEGDGVGDGVTTGFGGIGDGGSGDAAGLAAYAHAPALDATIKKNAAPRSTLFNNGKILLVIL
ncbi:MAG: hypothetical protein JO311_04025 [Candidatus Eremiobacteraeota bacterium]|nr:hypothetical protein [Candidatus Eremiobacteraeota bacterium]MBV9262886.1 hypothetical protein [Candidatus Eremiobacteraeota bacterium]